jgi:hypothetical protein
MLATSDPLPAGLHVVVCTPCFGGMVHHGYMLATTNLLLLGLQQGFTVSVELLGNDSLITRSRNTLVARFLDRPDATHLLFVDADITFQPHDVLRMAALDQDVVAGMYPLKLKGWTEDAVGRVRLGESPETAPLRYVGLPEAGQRRQSSQGFITAEYAGTGFMMIRRGALLAMMARHPELKFANAHDRATPNPSPYQFALFDCMIDPETRDYLSEDYTFCRRWRAMGGQIWLDTRARLIHTGPHDFTGNPSPRFAAAAGCSAAP